MQKGLAKITSEIDKLIENSDQTPLDIIYELKELYFQKLLKKNIELYTNKKKKVADITKELKISHKRFYKILEQENVSFTKYNKSKEI